jgi:cytidyltransferase-like protein
MKVVYTFICGDLFHVGHLRAIQDARAMGDYLIVGVLTDEAMMEYKRKPVISFEDRLEIVANIKGVDEVVTQPHRDPTSVLRIIKPDIVCHGDDWGENFAGAEYMRSIGKEARTFKYHTNARTTTDIIKEIKRRNDIP